ncbi:hypothetical protein [Nocardioides piscis]|uniref:Uncharacterized protein n=1 Tax=Nocardioides piscis TaxID=2714938 RepID=A0A6G7YH81_9ACTN|nr:hypothetical protein [Nocardioides piscis]QIK75991.1 hypothetical protein G7071_11630 [Nocardioides piscis]
MTEQSKTPEASSTTSEADADNQGGTAAPDDQQLAGVPDEHLPEDLKPGEDNPLAEPLDPDDESTKDADELGMDDTQDDTSGSYESSGPTPSTEEPTDDNDD